MFSYKDYVYEVYKEKSFSRAAENLYISQPSLSAKIKKLEGELGMPIFDRSTSPVRLTDFGKLYIEAIEQVYALERGLENYINDVNMLKSGKLNIGASNVFAAYVLPPMIVDFKARFPDVKINLIEGNTTTLERMLSDNDLDLVVDNNHYDSELYDKERYSSEKILLAVPSSLSVCESTKSYSLTEDQLKTQAYLDRDFPAVSLSYFKNVDFISLTPTNDTRIRADKMCREAGFKPRIVLEVHQQATAYMIATTGLGATFVSDTVARKMPFFECLSYYKLASDAATRDVYFYFKKHKSKTKAMLEFIRHISANS